MRPVLLSAVSVAGKFVGSICSLDLRCVACGFNEMPALYAPVFGEVPAGPEQCGNASVSSVARKGSTHRSLRVLRVLCVKA